MTRAFVRTTVPDLPGGVVARPRLYRLLAEAHGYPIITITGPAGWGKTQLLASWVRSPQCSLKAAWLTVDRADGDPRIFWPNVLAAVSRTRDRSDASDQGVDSVAPVLEALLGVEHPMLLILDDVHVIAGSTVEPELAELVRSLPPRVQLVLSGQYMPALPLARLRVEGKVLTLSGSDLAFTASESMAMFAESGIEVSEAVAAGLRDRTEGWSAGLRVAALSLLDGLPPEELLDQFGGDHIEVADYLMSEVLSRLPADVEDFLLRTSVCDRISGELATELTGRRDSAVLLRWMARHNLFTTADGPRQTWFRYHGMLGELLRSRLDQLGAETVRELHLTASAWFAERQMPVEAFEHAVRAEDGRRAADILVRAWLAMYLDGKFVQLGELIDRLPPEITSASELENVRTAVGLALGDGHLIPGDGALTGAGFDSYRAAAPAAPLPVEAAAHESVDPLPVEGRTPADGDQGDRSVAELVVALERARLAGDLYAAVSAAQAMTHLLESSDLQHRPDASGLRALALLTVGVTEYWAGRRADAEAHVREALSEAGGQSHAYVQLGCLGQLVLVLTAQNRLSEAFQESEAALDLIRRNGWELTGAAAALWHALGWATYVRGEVDLAEKHLDRAALAVRRQDAAISTTVLLTRGLIAGIRGRKRDGLLLLDEADRIRTRLRARYVFSDYLVAEQARLRIAVGDLEGARAILDSTPEDPTGPLHLSIARTELMVAAGMLVPAQEYLQAAIRAGQGLIDQHTQALVLLALLQAQSGDDTAAVDTMNEAVRLASPERFVQPFLQFGRPVERLLRATARLHPADRAVVDEVLRRADRLWPALEGQQVALGADAREHRLTQREIEVLRALDSLATLPEISASLFVSVNTLKAHLRSLYRKLEVTSRREAVARARSLGLA